MAKRGWFAVSIGIGKVGTMPLLPGARLDAKRFAEWAGRNGYATRLVTDDTGPVKVEQLESCVEEILANYVERLVIFFSGHGTTLPEGDYWLVSDSESRFKAINVSASERAARAHPIEQIAFIADACRSTVSWAAKLQPRNLIGYPEHDDPRGARVDSFYATRVGSVAQEVPDEVAAKTYGIFGKYLLQAINGESPAAFERDRRPPAVSSQSLALWLEEIIPLESGRIPGAVVQWPDARPGWFRPNDWYYTEEPRQPDREIRSHSDDLLAEFGDGARKVFVDGRRGPITVGPSPQAVTRVREAARAQARLVDEHHRLILGSKGREGFETRQGITVVGARITEVAGEPGRLAQPFPEDGNWHVRAQEGLAQSLAVQLDRQAWIGATSLPGFVATIATLDSRPVSLHYVPARHSPDHHEYKARGSEDVAAEWLALVSAQTEVSKERLHEFGKRLRQGKHANPTLGILAAYAYDRAGAQEEIDSIAWYFATRNHFVPFDVALLSRARVKGPGVVTRFTWDGRSADAPVVGAFPLMTRGWALLEPGRDAIHPGLLELRQGLLPVAWTCLNLDQGLALARMIRSGSLSHRGVGRMV
ncbi:MAG TPA: caspase family protein [Allosphingosinicella sp.]|jgi:hypothetical protein